MQDMEWDVLKGIVNNNNMSLSWKYIITRSAHKNLKATRCKALFLWHRHNLPVWHIEATSQQLEEIIKKLETDNLSVPQELIDAYRNF